MRTASALTLVVVGHALLLRPVDLHIGGVQVDGDTRAEPDPTLDGQQIDRSLHEVSDRGLDPDQMLRPEPASQTRSGRGRQHRHRRELARSHVGTLAIQGDQRIGTQQLGLRHANQQLARRRAAVALLQQADTAVEPAHDVELVDELRDRRDTRGRGQRWIRRAHPHTLPDPTTTTYSLHRQGALPAGHSKASRTSILQAGRAPSSSHTRITPPLLADPGQNGETIYVIRSGPRSRLVRRQAFASLSEAKPSCTATNSETEAAQCPTPAIRSWKPGTARSHRRGRPPSLGKSAASPRTPHSTCSSDCRATRMRRCARPPRAFVAAHVGP